MDIPLRPLEEWDGVFGLLVGELCVLLQGLLLARRQLLGRVGVGGAARHGVVVTQVAPWGFFSSVRQARVESSLATAKVGFRWSVPVDSVAKRRNCFESGWLKTRWWVVGFEARKANKGLYVKVRKPRCPRQAPTSVLQGLAHTLLHTVACSTFGYSYCRLFVYTSPPPPPPTTLDKYCIVFAQPCLSYLFVGFVLG